MIRRCFRPLMIVMPAAWAIGLYIVWYIVVLLLREFVFRVTQGFDAASIASTIEPFAKMQVATAATGAVLFAFWRVFAFHPITRWEYRQWLQQTPWTPDKPLPMSPIRPGYIDVLLVAVLCMMAGDELPLSRFAPIFAYLVALIVATCVVSGFTRQRVTVYLLLFGLGLAVRLAPGPIGPLLVLVALFPLVLLGLRRSLMPGHWPNYSLSLQRILESKNRAANELGWPFAFLGPRASQCYLQRTDFLAIAFLVGWFLQAGLSHTVLLPSDERSMIGLFTAAICLFALIRAVGYVFMFWSPISLLGRFLTGRWIIPEYDRVFAAPLAVAVTAILGEAFLYLMQVPAATGQPPVVALCVFLLLAIGPSMRNWELTGGHRITSFAVCNKSNQYVKV